MIPEQFKVDIFEELKQLMDTPYELCIFAATIEELTKISSTSNKDKPAAKVGLSLIKQQNLKILPNSFKNTGGEEHYIDAIILNTAKSSDIVCTQDKDLKRNLKAHDVKIITLKIRKRLGFA